MSKFFRDGWDFGIFTLVIGLPIVGAIIYIFGISLWEALSNPVDYLGFWFLVAIWFGPALVEGVRKLMTKRPTEGVSGRG